MNARCEVGIFSISDSLGGAEQILLKTARSLSKKPNYHIKIYFVKKKTEAEWFNISQTNVEIFFLDYNLIKLFRLLKKHKFDIVFSSHLLLNAYLGFLRSLKLLNTKKLIVRESTTVFGRFKGIKLLKYKIAYYSGYRNIDIIVCQTKLMSNELLKNAPYLQFRSQIKVVNNPFEYPEKKVVDSKIDIPENTIISAGRLIKEKGFDILINAFSKLNESYPELKLIILGEGPERDNLIKLIHKNNMCDKISLVGHVTNVYPYFRQAKLCVVSSRIEGFPNVLLQMMSQNNNVVSTLCAGDIKELKGIITCKTDSIIDLYNAILIRLKQYINNQNGNIFKNELDKRNIENFIFQILAV